MFEKAGTYFLCLTKVARHIGVARLTKLVEATLAAKTYGCSFAWAELISFETG